MGLQSAGLYYNMGNAYFKSGKIGSAILYYNKAQRLAPLNSDIDYNLTVANTYTRDNIGNVPQFFARRWIDGLRSALSSNTWAWLSVLFFGLLSVGALLYLLPLSLAARKRGWVSVWLRLPCSLFRLRCLRFSAANLCIPTRA